MCTAHDEIGSGGMKTGWAGIMSGSVMSNHCSYVIPDEEFGSLTLALPLAMNLPLKESLWEVEG